MEDRDRHENTNTGNRYKELLCYLPDLINLMSTSTQAYGTQQWYTTLTNG